MVQKVLKLWQITYVCNGQGREECCVFNGSTPEHPPEVDFLKLEFYISVLLIGRPENAGWLGPSG